MKRITITLSEKELDNIIDCVSTQWVKVVDALRSDSWIHREELASQSKELLTIKNKLEISKLLRLDNLNSKE